MTSPLTRNAIRGAAVAGALLIALTGCSTPAPETSAPAADVDPTAPEQSSITIAGYRQGSIAPTIAAGDLLEGYGMSIEVSYVESSAAGMAALIGGDVVATYSSYWGVIDAVTQGIDLVIAAEAIRFNPGALTFEVLPDSGIEDLADLEGTTVSVPALNSGHHNRLRYAMLQEGLDPSTVNFVELPFGEITSALVNGTIDVAAAGGPALTGLKNDYDSVTVLDLADGIFKDAAEGGWIMTREFAEANPNTVAAFQCAEITGADLVQDDELYVQILVDELGFEQSVAEGEVPKKPVFPTVIDNDKIQQFSDIMQELGLLGDDLDMTSLIVPLPTNC
jgi:NitT/TauT family transport system substrate-binding protein